MGCHLSVFSECWPLLGWHMVPHVSYSCKLIKSLIHLSTHLLSKELNYTAPVSHHFRDRKSAWWKHLSNTPRNIHASFFLAIVDVQYAGYICVSQQNTVNNARFSKRCRRSFWMYYWKSRLKKDLLVCALSASAENEEVASEPCVCCVTVHMCLCLPVALKLFRHLEHYSPSAVCFHYI